MHTFLKTSSIIFLLRILQKDLFSREVILNVFLFYKILPFSVYIIFNRIQLFKCLESLFSQLLTFHRVFNRTNKVVNKYYVNYKMLQIDYKKYNKIVVK